MDITDKGFEDLLLSTALYIICIDGVVDDREIAKLRNFARETPYFEVDAVEDVIRALAEVVGEVSRARSVPILSDLSDRSQRRVLEVVYDLICADDVIEEDERLGVSRLLVSMQLDRAQAILAFPFVREVLPPLNFTPLTPKISSMKEDIDGSSFDDLLK